MDLAHELRAQGLVDEAVAGETRQAPEPARDEADGEMGLAAFPPAGMAPVAFGFVPDLQDLRAEDGLKAFCDPGLAGRGGCGHRPSLRLRCGGPVSRRDGGLSRRLRLLTVRVEGQR